MERRFSKDEARQVFANAAERQQAVQRADVDELTLAELEEAGLAAGIDPAFVRAAAADLLRPDRMSVRRRFIGLPVELRRTRIVPEAIGDDDWSRIVTYLQEVFGKTGVAHVMGPTREWSSSADSDDMPVHVVIEQDGQVSHVTIERKTWPRALGFGLATIINFVTGLILGIVWLATGLAGPLWLPAIVLIGFSVVFGFAAVLGVQAQDRREAKRFDAVIRYVAQLVEKRSARSAGREMRDSREEPAGTLAVDLDDTGERHPRAQGTRQKDRS